jgi:ABC-type Fe3+ transport system substrate-binding protein
LSAAFSKQDLNGLPLYDTGDPPTWFGTALSSFGIVYNKDVLKFLKLPEPKTWSDLSDPRYRGWVVLADPTRSAAANAAYMVIVERAMADGAADGRGEDAGWADGMGLLRRIAANVRLFTDATSAIPGVVSSGDVAAGMTIDFHARAQVDAVGEARLGYVEPVGATSINPDPIALVKGAEHQDIAIRFIEFILSDRGQRLWNTRAGAPGGPQRTSLRRLPIMQSVYDSPVNFTDNVNPYAASAGFNTNPARRKTFSFLADLIEMSCMDLLEELRAVPPGKLAAFPFDQAEAIRRGKVWQTATPLERLELKRKWTDEFRAEYRVARTG